MQPTAILSLRLACQQISAHQFTTIPELVSWMGCMQAQDYAQSQWAVGIRIPGVQDIDIDAAIANKEIIRTWCIRGTLHLVAAADVHWLLTLLAPRIITAGAARYRNLELDDKILKKCSNILARALKDNESLSREELTATFAKAKIEAKGERLTHILYRAALEQLICTGPKRGNTPTYTLLPSGTQPGFKHREAALAALAKKYFNSRGPATLQDFVWWSGLSPTEARQGLEAAQAGLTSFTHAQQTYWMSATQTAAPKPGLYCLPGFDEYMMAYADRSLFLPSQHASRVYQVNGIFNPMIVQKGEVIGTWARTFKKDTVSVQTNLFSAVTAATQKKIQVGFNEFATFAGKELE
ncbi:winged helix DNA-binding domain-containing protein [Chitinophaga agrisoli]|uniref:Winged helix DNA-binding domain-containing protein n=1 Tax=Chitinophaga agrisoli TaxID=2607653 RepID=A0A5B2VYQ1_9BACT|nr:winged helix DNA-binding domain-containing protein [Chitinophaga agrisoli]KAA2243778.1 winged helix DNA-binding domain-containing protein [Chitinophaga agrisoli]